MSKRQFKTESKRILDLMVNSIYTHKEIFLRELISNASDAIDKLCYRCLTDDTIGMSRDDFKITVSVDEDARRITISDNGIGMTAEDLESNLGVIARSGSLKFKSALTEEDKKDSDIDIIGQFGVGFYSAFMVGAKVAVITKSAGEEGANYWVSSGADGYTIKPCEKATVGTDVVIELKEDGEEEDYSKFLKKDFLKYLIKKYSDYIRWPIIIDGETINSMTPIWQRSKSDVSDEDCISFYKEKFYDAADPVSVIRVSAEGAVSYKAMLFIPEKVPFNYYTASYEAGLQLYTSGVMIMENCADLLPECFRFVRGVVDSQDLSLNISREILQHNRQLKIIASNLEKKIKAELKKLLTNSREKYEAFYKSFSLQLKYGVLGEYGAKKDLLSDLLLFYSQKEGKMVSLAEYAEKMPLDQKYIYFACGDSVSIIDNLPQTERVKEKGYDILYLTEGVDEMVVAMIGQVNEKEFRSVNSDDIGIDDDASKETIEKTAEENKELLTFVKETIEGVEAVKISAKLRSHPVCLTTQGGVTLEMEKYFASLPSEEANMIKAQRVLELNPDHGAFEALKKAYAEDKDKAAKYAKLLYGQALLIAGVPLENPATFADLISELMI